jgi:hypothetical protein
MITLYLIFSILTVDKIFPINNYWNKVNFWIKNCNKFLIKISS